jgi:arylsulfatase A-like enzyme
MLGRLRRESRPRRTPARLRALACAVSAALWLPGCSFGPRDERPHVVLVVVDALRRDYLGTYGHPRPTSPHLDRLAAEGILFENAWAQAPQTLVSTASLLTGRLVPLIVWPETPRDMGDAFADLHFGSRGYLAHGDLTLAELMRRGGYQTAAFFTSPYHNPRSGFDQGFEHAPFLSAFQGRGGYAPASRVTRKVREWLDERDDARPFFAYVHYMDVHSPYRPPYAHKKLFVTAEGEYKYVNGIPEDDRMPSPEDLLYTKQLYEGEIHYADEEIGELSRALREASDDRSVVLIVTSDHGDQFMEHGGLGHGTTMEKELLRIPLIVHGVPGRSGERVSGLARNLDLAPTVLALAGIPAPAELEGRDLLSGDSAELSLGWYGRLRSVTTPSWHLAVDRRRGSRHLYDNRRDPRGLEDLSARHPKTVAALRSRLPALDAELVRMREAAAEVDATEALAPDPELAAQLRALGYLNASPAERGREPAPK